MAPKGRGRAGPLTRNRVTRWLGVVWSRVPLRRWSGTLGPERPSVRPGVRLRLALLSAGTAILAAALALGATYALLTAPAGLALGVAAQYAESEGSAGLAAPHVSATLVGSRKACLALLQGLPTPTPGSLATHAVIRGGAANLSPPRARAVEACIAALPPEVASKGVFIAIARVQRAEDLRQFVVRGGVALGILALLALGAGWWVAGRILDPLQIMTRRVRELSARMPLGRIRLTGPRDELKDLADTFDDLLGRLDSALAADRRFVANASHELRTPLAIQETLLDVALADPDADAHSLREMAERLRQVNARSRRLIDGLLALARSQQGLGRWEPVDLAAAARDAIRATDAEASGREIRFEPDLQPAPVRGDPALLERLAGNLVENAVRYNSPGGWVRIRTATDGPLAVLSVANSGPIVAPSEIAGLFEPFRRGARDRTDSHRGAGLGLSIVQAVAAAHGGTVQAEAHPEGGLTVTVAVPVLSED